MSVSSGQHERPDLAFSFSQLSKFLQYPGDAHLAAAYRVLSFVKGTLNQGLSHHDPGVGKRNKLSGWVRHSQVGDVLPDGPQWRSRLMEGLTLRWGYVE